MGLLDLLRFPYSICKLLADSQERLPYILKVGYLEHDIRFRWLLPDSAIYTHFVPDLSTAPHPKATVVREMCCIRVEVLEKAIAQNILRVGDLVLRNIVQREFYVGLCMMVSVMITATTLGEHYHVQRLLAVL